MMYDVTVVRSKSTVSNLQPCFQTVQQVIWSLQGFFGRELPEDFGLQHAGEFLASNFGKSYKYIWGLGLLAAGQASTMSGTYTGLVLV